MEALLFELVAAAVRVYGLLLWASMCAWLSGRIGDGQKLHAHSRIARTWRTHDENVGIQQNEMNACCCDELIFAISRYLDKSDVGCYPAAVIAGHICSTMETLTSVISSVSNHHQPVLELR